MVEFEEESLKNLSSNINAAKQILDNSLVDQNNDNQPPKAFPKDVYDNLVIERYKNVSGHLTHLTEVCRYIFFLFAKLFIVGVAAQIATIGVGEKMWIVADSKYLINYLIYIVLLATTFFFSLQIIFCLSQWHMFRNLLTKLFDENLIDQNSKISAPNFGNWLFELSYIAMFLIGMLFSGVLVVEAYSKTEDAVRLEFNQECNKNSAIKNGCLKADASIQQVEKFDARIKTKIESLSIMGGNANFHPAMLLTIIMLILVIVTYVSFNYIKSKQA